ncbi:MAG: shikimate kinase [Lachnospiraceae bacterium]|nr:shikimate kinase [Lachnospiraceae bacterium]
MVNNNNIILIGMPGSGKSTIGVLLAKKLGMSFVDTDILIQENEGRLLKDIIAEEGLDGFIAIENRINAGIKASNSVIAPGGSAVYGKEAMEHFARLGTIIYLKLSYDTVKSRLGDLRERGVVFRPGQTLKDIYDERTVLYEKYAHVTVNGDSTVVSEVLLRVNDALQNVK